MIFICVVPSQDLYLHYTLSVSSKDKFSLDDDEDDEDDEDDQHEHALAMAMGGVGMGGALPAAESLVPPPVPIGAMGPPLTLEALQLFATHAGHHGGVGEGEAGEHMGSSALI